MRSKWIDKATGKVINLSNYSFNEMSGWGGYAYDWKKWISNDVTNTGTVLTKTGSKVHVTYLGNNPLWAVIYKRNETFRSERIRISGLKDGARVIYGRTINQEDANTYITLSNGINVINGDDVTYFQLSFAIEGYSANEEADLLIEQLPLYPGALVSDGVDDYISEDGTLGEAVGTVLIHWKDIGLKNGHYLYNTGYEDTGRLYCYRYRDGDDMGAGVPAMAMSGEPIMCFTREPAVPQDPLNNNAGENNCPIFRLIFIKEKLDEYQQEFLMWKVSKEYRDWCKENGYEYAISEMLNN